MHWVRALAHMYCLSFQQLEREASTMHSQYAAHTRANTTSKRAVADCLHHMMHVWSMLGRCINSIQWRSIVTGREVSATLLEWYCQMPPISDEGFARSSLQGTYTLDNYPRYPPTLSMTTLSG